MSIKVEADLIDLLEKIDKKTLYFISRRAEERRRNSVWIATTTATIGTVAGAAIIFNSALPHLNQEVLGILSGIVGCVVAISAVISRKRDDDKRIRELLLKALILENGVEEQSKRDLIERFLKAEGL